MTEKVLEVVCPGQNVPSDLQAPAPGLYPLDASLGGEQAYYTIASQAEPVTMFTQSDLDAITPGSIFRLGQPAPSASEIESIRTCGQVAAVSAFGVEAEIVNTIVDYDDDFGGHYVAMTVTVPVGRDVFRAGVRSFYRMLGEPLKGATKARVITSVHRAA